MHLLVSNGETLLIRRRVDKPSGAALPHAQLVAHLVGTIPRDAQRVVIPVALTRGQDRPPAPLQSQRAETHTAGPLPPVGCGPAVLPNSSADAPAPRVSRSGTRHPLAPNMA